MPYSQPFTLPPKSSDQLAYVLDDKPQVRTMLGNILASIGYVPRQFAGLVPFFEVFKNAAQKLIVLSLVFGESDAIEVIRYLEAIRFRGKVLLVTRRDPVTLGDIQRIGEDHGLTM